MEYLFRKPSYPVILVAGKRVFRAISKATLARLVRRELKSTERLRVLDRTWEWFEYVADHDVLAPSFVDRVPPTKQDLIDLANNRTNRSAESEHYSPRSLSSSTRDQVFHELLGIVPTS